MPDVNEQHEHALDGSCWCNPDAVAVDPIPGMQQLRDRIKQRADEISSEVSRYQEELGWDDPDPEIDPDTKVASETYSLLVERAASGSGAYLTGERVEALVIWISNLVLARDRVIRRMDETIAARKATDPEPPMINAKQVLSLLSLTWPDGNYSN